MSQGEFTLLLVDDEPDILEMVSLQLADESRITILSAFDGVEAFDVISSNKVDLVVTDIRMPSMDGIQLLSKIKNLDPPGPAVFLLTGSVYLDVEFLYDLGCEGVFFKPVDIQLLIKNIMHELKRSAAYKELGVSSRQKRFPLSLKVTFDKKYHFPDKPLITENLGRGGIFIPWPTEVFPAKSMTLEFDLGFKYKDVDYSARIIGEVAWIRKNTTPHGQRGIGIKFQSMRGPHVAQLMKLINALNTLAYIPKNNLAA